jgi:predicted AAA+ superfamily ATPase
VFDINFQQKVFLFVDEIQNLKNWSKWARRITEKNKNIKLIITGSSAKLLSKEIASELRGRSISHTVFPLSFSEFLRAKDLPVPSRDLLLSTERPLLNKYFREYVTVGGFPAVVTSPNRRELLSSYYNVMFHRDIVERHHIQNIRLLEDFLVLMLDQTACAFSVSATAKKLQGFGHQFSKNTLSNFMSYATDAFLAFAVKKYSFKVREQLRAYRKIYAIDHGLVDAVRFSFMENYGHVLENIVYLQLRRKTEDIYYHLGNKECDFIVTDRGRVSEAIQVTVAMHQTKTRQREIEGVVEAMEKYKTPAGLILTDDENEDIVIKDKIIQVRPIWWWLLQK